MAQPYKSRVAVSKAALLENNSTPGAKGISYYETPNGFKATVNGCEFRELTLVIVKDGSEREQQIIEGELLRPDGTRCWVYQGIQGWRVDAHNAHAMQAMVKTYNEGEKTRKEASLAGVMEQVKTLKQAGVPAHAIRAALTAQGVDSVKADELIKSST